jgi:hypothetical protein
MDWENEKRKKQIIDERDLPKFGWRRVDITEISF